MAENIFERARRVVSAALEDGVERLEQASGTKLMKQAVREVDYAIEDAEDEYVAAEKRKSAASAQAGILREEAAEWREKAEYALSKDRDDLAEAAIAENVRCKKKARNHEEEGKQAAKDMERLGNTQKELREKRVKLQNELDDYLAAERKAKTAARPSPDYEGKMSDILKRFEHIMDMPLRSKKAGDRKAAPADDFDEMQERDEIDAALAELKKSMKARTARQKNPR